MYVIFKLHLYDSTLMCLFAILAGKTTWLIQTVLHRFWQINPTDVYPYDGLYNGFDRN